MRIPLVKRKFALFLCGESMDTCWDIRGEQKRTDEQGENAQKNTNKQQREHSLDEENKKYT